LISLIRNEINERYNARAATPDAYLNHMLKFNCSQDQIQTIIACLKESSIIQNGEVLVANIPQSLDDHMGLPKELHKQSKLIKTKLLEYAKAIGSEQQKAWSKDFTDSLRDSLSSSAQKVITGAFDSEFAKPIFELCSREFIKDFRQKTSEFFEDIFSGTYKEKAEIAKIQKDYQNALKQSQNAKRHSLTYTTEEPKTSPKTKQDVALKSKDDTDGYTSVPANDSPQISHPQSNPPQGSMSFPDQEALDAHRRSTGELNIRDSKSNPIDINALASMIDKNQNAAISASGQDPEQGSILGYRKSQTDAPKASQRDALNTAGNFGRAANILRFVLHQGGKAAAPTVVRGALAEAGALAAGGSEFAGAFIASQPEFWIPVGLVAAWYYRDDIASGFKSAYQAITSGNESNSSQSEFNSSGKVQEISKQEYAAERGNNIMTKPEYRVAQGPSLEYMGINKPAIKEPVVAIPTPARWSETPTPSAVRGQTTVDDTKPLAISTPAGARFANVANISTTFDPIPQEEPLPVPPYHIPELNLFQKCPIRLEAREGMREDAKAAVKDKVCPIFRGYSNQKLAQTLVDIACGIKFDPLFANVPKHIAGTFQHTHLMEVNKAYSEICGDYRFKAEIYYSYGEDFNPKNQPRGSTKGMIRVDLRTTEPVGQNLNGNDIYEVYDLKTGDIGITEKQLQNHIKNLPDDILYEVKPGGWMPVQIYPKI